MHFYYWKCFFSGNKTLDQHLGANSWELDFLLNFASIFFLFSFLPFYWVKNVEKWKVQYRGKGMTLKVIPDYNFQSCAIYHLEPVKICNLNHWEFDPDFRFRFQACWRGTADSTTAWNRFQWRTRRQLKWWQFVVRTFQNRATLWRLTSTKRQVKRSLWMWRCRKWWFEVLSLCPRHWCSRRCRRMTVLKTWKIK